MPVTSEKGLPVAEGRPSMLVKGVQEVVDSRDATEPRRKGSRLLLC